MGWLGLVPTTNPTPFGQHSTPCTSEVRQTRGRVHGKRDRVDLFVYSPCAGTNPYAVSLSNSNCSSPLLSHRRAADRHQPPQA